MTACPAVRRPGPGWPRCCSAASTWCCSTSPPTTSTSPASSARGLGLGAASGVVLVSHDREFLARCVTRIVELDLAQHAVAVYDGGYDAFLEERAVARRHAREAYEEFADKKADLVRRARTQREWSSQGVRNAIKKSPDNDKIRRKASVESSEKQAQKVRQMESRIARLEEVEEPRKEWVLQFSDRRRAALQLGGRDAERGGRCAGATSPSARSACRSARGSGSAITGPNGAGKTTLLRLLLGRLRAGDGQRRASGAVGRGRRDRPGPGRSGRGPALGAAFEAAVPDLAPAEVRTLLAKFGLKADQVTGLVGRLSPGERTRAALALLQARGVNLLVLDEPTNHLDLPAIEQLEQALRPTTGPCCWSRHDRRLLDERRARPDLDGRGRVGPGASRLSATGGRSAPAEAARTGPACGLP